MADPNSSFSSTPSSFGRKGVPVIASVTDIDPVPKAIVALNGGDITVVPRDNLDAETISFVGVPAGFVLPYVVRRVTAVTGNFATVEG